MRDEMSRVILLIAGIAILASGVLHGLVNVPHLHEDLLEIGVRATLVRAIMLVLYFSVVAMCAFGGIVVGSAGGISREGRARDVTLWMIAVSYTVFGTGGFMLVSPTHHMLAYAGMGLLVAIGAVLSRGLTDGRIRGVV